MFGQLWIKECKQTAKSLTYWLIILVLILDFATQLGGMEIMQKPKEGQEDYGWHTSNDKDIIMESTLGILAEEYNRESYTTYPIGFYKQVTLDESEDQKIAEILKEATGLDGRAEIDQKIEEWYGSQQDDSGQMTAPLALQPSKGLSYERFEELMDQADSILGGGSSYGAAYRKSNAQIPMTYEEALEEYHALLEKDKITGGYARLFSDYMVIFLGILPVFLSVARGLRDRRAGMQELIYTRKCPSIVIVASRYFAMLVMLILPVLMISLVPLSQCMAYGKAAALSVDMLAFVKYTFGWLVPTIMAVLAVGMFLTELTDTALAVLLQGAWWFVGLFSGSQDILHGGLYGWNLMPRHNTELNWAGYHSGFSQLAANRILYALSAIALVALTAFVYTMKRKGRLQIRGKILANRKSKSKA
ncbi:MAG: ABC transporter permease [Eubacteriales bacterium]|nr:ABC transporter permease [Eubacteriales bacterium]